MQANFEIHPEEDRLELYSMGRLPKGEVAPIEEHLLICSTCQDRLAEIDQFITAMQTAGEKLRRQTAATKQKKPWSWWNPGELLAWFPKPVGAIAFAALAVMIVVGVRSWGPGSELQGTPVEVRLALSRGETESVPAQVGKPFQLVIDLSELPASDQYRLSIVDARGGEVLEQSIVGQSARLTLTVRKPLTAGSYWVRLYQNETEDSLVREFALSVR